MRPSGAMLSPASWRALPRLYLPVRVTFRLHVRDETAPAKRRVVPVRNAATKRATVPVDADWFKQVEALTNLRGVLDWGSDLYLWLVWQWHLAEQHQLSSEQLKTLRALPDRVQSLRDTLWVSRFLEVADLDAAGQPLTGQWRTQWLTRQRRMYRDGALARGRIQLLELLDGFSWEPVSDQWNRTFAVAADFAALHGRIPSRADHAALAGWLATQRFSLRSGRLNKQRAAALTELPGWSSALAARDSRMPWEWRREQLRVFLDEQDRYPSVRADDPTEAALGAWVRTQRDQFRRGDLIPSRAQALLDLPGWRFSAHAAAWDVRLREVSAAAREAGGIRTDHPLYGWVVNQRRRGRAGQLSAQQTAALEALNLLEGRLSRSA